MTREETARWLSELYAVVADGRTMQYEMDGTWWDQQCGPDMNSNVEHWRIKPEPREVVRTVEDLPAWEASAVVLPDDWKPGTKVRVTEIIEE